MEGGHFGIDSFSDMEVSEHYVVQGKSAKWGHLKPWFSRKGKKKRVKQISLLSHPHFSQMFK